MAAVFLSLSLLQEYDATGQELTECRSSGRYYSANMPLTQRRRTGFTTVEVMFALVLISIALITLEGATARTVRRIADSHRESIAADFARQQIDRIIATPCMNGAGIDSANGVAVQWSTNALNGIASVNQQLRYPIALGMHTESLQSTVSCK